MGEGVIFMIVFKPAQKTVLYDKQILFGKFQCLLRKKERIVVGLVSNIMHNKVLENGVRQIHAAKIGPHPRPLSIRDGEGSRGAKPQSFPLIAKAIKKNKFPQPVERKIKFSATTSLSISDGEGSRGCGLIFAQ